VELKGSDAVLAGCGRQTLELGRLAERAVAINREDADGAHRGIQSEQVLAVATHGEIEVDAIRRIAADNGASDWGQRPLRTDGKSCNVRAACIGSIDEAAVGSGGVPAVRRTQGRHALADRDQRSVGLRCVGGDRRVVSAARCAGLRDDELAVGSEARGEGARSGTGIDHGSSQRAVSVNGEDVDVVGQPFGHGNEAPVGTDGDRCTSYGVGAQERRRVINGAELPPAVETESHHAARSSLVQHVDKVLVLRDRDRIAAARRLKIGERELSIVSAKDRDVSAACVDGEQQRVIGAQGKRALRLQRIVDATAASASGVVVSAFRELSIAVPEEAEDFIAIGVVCHDEYRFRLSGCRFGSIRYGGENDDSQRAGQEPTNSYLHGLTSLVVNCVLA
jgi:hypothetical protein